MRMQKLHRLLHGGMAAWWDETVVSLCDDGVKFWLKLLPLFVGDNLIRPPRHPILLACFCVFASMLIQPRRDVCVMLCCCAMHALVATVRIYEVCIYGKLHCLFSRALFVLACTV